MDTGSACSRLGAGNGGADHRRAPIEPGMPVPSILIVAAARRFFNFPGFRADKSAVIRGEPFAAVAEQFDRVHSVERPDGGAGTRRWPAAAIAWHGRPIAAKRPG
jgi:hypothetical protein